MLKTVKAKVNTDGKVKLLEPIKISKESNAILTILEDEIDDLKEIDMASLNEKSLAEDWSSEADSRWDSTLT